MQMYSLCECALSHVLNTRYLGIIMQENLHWHKYINSLTVKASYAGISPKEPSYVTAHESWSNLITSILLSKPKCTGIVCNRYSAAAAHALERFQRKGVQKGSNLNPLAGKFSEDTRKKGKGAKTGISRLAELLFVAIWLAKGY